MLNSYQVDLVCCLSGTAYMGLIFGGLCGLFVGAATRALRTRNLDESFAGLMLGAIPGAVVASAVALSTVALAIAVFQTAVFREDIKGYGCPEWFVNATMCVILVTGAVAGYSSARRELSSEGRNRMAVRMLLWGLAGGLLMSISNVGLGFDGYFVIRSNAEPLRRAIGGFIVGAIIAAGWRCMIAASGRCQSLNHSSPA